MRLAVNDEIGSVGEKIVREWLVQNGYSILPASLINSMGAPMLIGSQMKIILPDNLTWRDGKSNWVEVKTKSVATYHQSWPQRWEHGLPLRHWAAYEIIQQKTQTEVSLAILELKTHLLLLSTINQLKHGERIFPMEKEFHIFLNRQDFDWYQIDLELPEPILPCATRSLLQDLPPTEKQIELRLK